MNPLQLFLLPTLNLEMKKKKVWPVGVFLCWAQVGDSGSSSLAPHTLLSCPCWQWSHDLHLPLMLDVKSNSPLKISSCLMQCQNRPETLQSCQKNSKLRMRCFSSWCPVFLCILLDHKKWLEWLDGFFPVSLQEALLHGGQSEDSCAYTSPPPCKRCLVNLFRCDSVISKARSPLQIHAWGV